MPTYNTSVYIQNPETIYVILKFTISQVKARL